MTEPYPTLRKLRNGEVVDLEGIKLRMADGKLKIGDLYVAERNTGPHLLTVKGFNEDGDVVFPTTHAYCFNAWECVKVEEDLSTAITDDELEWINFERSESASDDPDD